MKARHLIAGAVVLAASFATQAQAQVGPADETQIRALFQRQTAAENAHDINELAAILAPKQADGVDPAAFLSRPGQYWGRDAVLGHFQSNFTGTWRLVADEKALRVVPLGADTALIYVPTDVTIGQAGEAPVTGRFLINEIALRTPDGWRISVIVPVPAK